MLNFRLVATSPCRSHTAHQKFQIEFQIPSSENIDGEIASAISMKTLELCESFLFTLFSILFDVYETWEMSSSIKKIPW